LGSAIGSVAQSDWLSLPLTPENMPPAPLPGRTDLVWLDQTERPVRSVEDRELQERALGSADTTTRLRPQLRLRVLEDVPADCSLAALALRETRRLGGHARGTARDDALHVADLTGTSLASLLIQTRSVAVVLVVAVGGNVLPAVHFIPIAFEARDHAVAVGNLVSIVDAWGILIVLIGVLGTIEVGMVGSRNGWAAATLGVAPEVGAFDVADDVGVG
ncbi:MAG: hypothetical protein HGA75_19165, partial [Thiobacillus sp.]|nr:hypothetical protein [Thiobacillus sp.]